MVRILRPVGGIVVSLSRRPSETHPQRFDFCRFILSPWPDRKVPPANRPNRNH